MSVLQVATQLAYWGPIMNFSIGVPAALFNVLVFLGMKTFRQCPTTYYIIGQSLADVSALFIVLLQAVTPISMVMSSVACKLFVYFAALTTTSSMSFICLSAFDRWACTSQSVWIRQLSSNRIARRLFLLPSFIWSLVHIPFLIYFDLIPPTFICYFNNDHFKQIATYFLGPILFTLFPLLVLIMFGVFTFRNIHRVPNIRRQQVRTRFNTWEQQMTRMMLVQTLLSVSCTLPRAIFLIYSIVTMKERITRSLDHFPVELLVDQLTVFIMSFNFTSSFYIFFFSSPRLRQVIKLHLKRRLNLRPNQIVPRNNIVLGSSLTTRKIVNINVKLVIENEQVE